MGDHPLKHYEEFKRILSAYSVSGQAKDTLKDLKLVLMIAPTSGGRNTVIRHLIGTGRYHNIVSDTTRSPRSNDGILEQNGVEYWFKSEDEVLDGLNRGEYVEAELLHGQQVSGISIRELQRAKAENKTAITDVDLEGIHNIVAVKPDTVCVMLLPPSFAEWQARLTARSVMNEDELRRRMGTAYNVFRDGLEQNYYKYIITENVEQTGKIIDALVDGGLNPHQDRGEALLQQLLDGLEEQKLNH